MSDDPLDSLLAGLEEAARVRAPVDADGEAVLRVSCSMADGPVGVSLWPADAAWHVGTVRTLGNQTWEHHDDQRVVAGGVAGYGTDHDVRAVQVVGHTGCRVLEDAYERCVAADRADPPGVQARLAPLVSLVADALDAGVVDPAASPRTARARLVEYNVGRQVEFLRERLPGPVDVVGYVHDEDGVYGSFPGKHHLVSVDGETDPDTVRAEYPATESVPVSSLLR